MKDTYKLVSRWLLVFSIPVSIMLFVFPENILSLFGYEYLVSKNVLVVLTASTLIQAFFGAASPTLGMSGFAKLVLVNTAIAFILNFVLNYYLIPLYGIKGAAYATLITMTLIGLLRSVQVRFYLKMNFLSLKMMKPLVSGLVTYLILRQTKNYFEDFHFFIELLIGCFSCLIIYSLIIWAMKIEEEDKSFISGFGIIRKGLKNK